MFQPDVGPKNVTYLCYRKSTCLQVRIMQSDTFPHCLIILDLLAAWLWSVLTTLRARSTVELRKYGKALGAVWPRLVAVEWLVTSVGGLHGRVRLGSD